MSCPPSPTPSSVRSRSRSVPPLLYLSWRATFTCLALARPRPIGSTPSTCGALPRLLFPALSNTGFAHMVRRVVLQRLERDARSSPHASITVPALRRKRFPAALSILDPTAPPKNPRPPPPPSTPPPPPLLTPLIPPPRPGLVRGSAGQPDAPEPANLGHPPLGQPVGGHSGRHALFVRQREYLLGGHVDLLGPHAGPLEVETSPLVRDLDDPARVDQVVGGVQDPAVGEHLLQPGMRELVVGAAADDAGGQRRD